jgi:hypothetical protein
MASRRRYPRPQRGHEMNECQHDPLYREMTEAMGGIGCPLCNRKRIEALRARNAAAPDVPGRFDNPIKTLELDPLCAALLAQHNADVDERKRNGDKRSSGPTFISLLEQSQREGKV